MIRAVIFDMDGLLLDSEVYWEEARREYCLDRGCNWRPDDESAVKGMNSPEWAAAIATRCAFGGPRDDIIAGVSQRMRAHYDRRLPLLPGAREAVRSVAARYPTAIASSSPSSLIEFAMTEAGLRGCFTALVSADDVGRGKPNPDVFLVAAERLATSAHNIAVLEDSTAGILAGLAAGMTVIAVPNERYPPRADVLSQAHTVLRSLEDFQVALLDKL